MSVAPGRRALITGAGSGLAARSPGASSMWAADVAAPVLPFIDDETGFLTGVALDVDGGASLGHLPGT